MLPGMSGIDAPFEYIPLYDAILDLGYGTNLKFCIDANDARCYSSGSQTVNSVAGLGPNFYLGNTASVETSDPTFVANTVQGGFNYFSTDGGDWLRASESLPSWAASLGARNNDVTVMLGVSLASNINCTVIGNKPGSETGFSYDFKQYGSYSRFTSNYRPNTRSTTDTWGTASPLISTFNAPMIVGLSTNAINDGDTYTSFYNGTYTTGSIPSNATNNDSSEVLYMMTARGTTNAMPANSKLMFILIWQGINLGYSGMNAIYQSIKSRYFIA